NAMRARYDEVAAWNRGLSSNEVEEVFNRGRFGLPVDGPELVSQPLTNNLVAMYHFEGDLANEGSYGYEGSIVGSNAVFSTSDAFIGRSFHSGFNDAYAVLPGFGTIDGSTNFTISFWVFHAENNQYNGAFGLGDVPSSGTQTLMFWQSGTGPAYQFYGTGFGNSIAYSQVLFKWDFICLTSGSSPGNVQVFKGTLGEGLALLDTLAIDAGETLNGGEYAFVGTKQNWGGDFEVSSPIRCRVDEVAAWTRGLNYAEVLQVFETGDSGLHFNESASDPVVSESIEHVSGDIFRMTVDISGGNPPVAVPEAYKPLKSTDLVSVPFADVAHSTNGAAPWYTTNLTYSVDTGSNYVIYLESTNPAAFFGLGNVE
ncbi:MAG: hypothetical protein ABFR47_08895, partial [Verrucomicrobiota bacterium]